MTKQAWYNDLQNRSAIRKRRTLWERGYILSGKVIVTSSPQHSFHLSIDNVVAHTFAKPCPLKTFTVGGSAETYVELTGKKAERYMDSSEQLAEGGRRRRPRA